jgi:hypothetical protein
MNGPRIRSSTAPLPIKRRGHAIWHCPSSASPSPTQPKSTLRINLEQSARLATNIMELRQEFTNRAGFKPQSAPLGTARHRCGMTIVHAPPAPLLSAAG